MSKKEMMKALEELKQEMLNPDEMMKKHNIKKLENFYPWMYGWALGTISNIIEDK